MTKHVPSELHRDHHWPDYMTLDINITPTELVNNYNVLNIFSWRGSCNTFLSTAARAYLVS